MNFRCLPQERGAFLVRYAVIIALAVFVCFLAFTTVGQEAIARIWALGQRISEA
ncbi:MAG: hypothetical protein M3203_07625 [Actinomycetota bacterium]|nr:hypothetical protein [Actinomycetota bacterium]